MKETGLFVVRAVVADPADRIAFDRWYGEEHLRDATIAFGASKAWRCWSESDPAVHLAFYQLASPAAAAALVGSPALSGLAADFDSRWQGRVTRSREILRIAGDYVPGAK